MPKCAKYYRDKEKLKEYKARSRKRYYSRFTKENAENSYKPWTEDEINTILNSGLSHYELAKKLGRSISSVQNMKSKIMREQNKVNLELGNIIFNSNKVQKYECPWWIIALLRDIERELKLTMFAIKHEEYESPFDNTGNDFIELKDIFEVQAYNWNEDHQQEYNFIFKAQDKYIGDIKISWYKYLGRDTTISYNVAGCESVILKLYNKCIEALKEYRNKNENHDFNSQSIKSNKDAEWEIGNCTDNEVIYLNIKGKSDKRYAKLHLNIDDAQKLASDIDKLVLNKYFNEPNIKIIRKKENENE